MSKVSDVLARDLSLHSQHSKQKQTSNTNNNNHRYSLVTSVPAEQGGDRQIWSLLESSRAKASSGFSENKTHQDQKVADNEILTQGMERWLRP